MRARLTRVDAVLIQAVIAAALSFAHLHDIADAAGQDGWKAWAYPISVDLLLVAAWRRLRSGEGKAAGLVLVRHRPDRITRRQRRHRRTARPARRPGLAPHPRRRLACGRLPRRNAPRPHPSRGSQRSDASGGARTAVPQPEPTAATPTQPPELESTRPVPAIPAALLDHARKVATDHHTRTGTPIDTPTLRARLGVPAPLAEAIATHL